MIGLFKKTCLPTASSRWSRSPSAQAAPTFDQAWSGALAYTFQLYFDFSGYSDMAIGLSLMFGISLPLNFNSPYKADSIIDFWRRWHMTLSRFLRDYLYIPLGGNRRGRGALCQPDGHDAARRPLARRGLDVRRLGRAARRSISASITPGSIGPPIASAFGASCRRCRVVLTFLAVVVAWVFFRADSLPQPCRYYPGWPIPLESSSATPRWFKRR